MSSTAQAPKSDTASTLNGLRVLLVEDSWIIAQSYAGLLEPLGVSVLGPAANLSDAARLFAENEIDAALVDINLQGEQAYDLIDTIHQRGIPVVVVTGYELLPRLGDKAFAVLKKPIRAEQLLRALRSIGGKAHASEVVGASS